LNIINFAMFCHFELFNLCVTAIIVVGITMWATAWIIKTIAYKLKQANDANTQAFEKLKMQILFREMDTGLLIANS
jgi:hypothetical protein